MKRHTQCAAGGARRAGEGRCRRRWPAGCGTSSQTSGRALQGNVFPLLLLHAACAASESPQQQDQSQAQPAPQELRTHRNPTDKDKTNERLQSHVDGRKMCFTRNNDDNGVARETLLLEWLVQLLEVQPDLGYRAEHVDSMLLGLRFVVQRVLRRCGEGDPRRDGGLDGGGWLVRASVCRLPLHLRLRGVSRSTLRRGDLVCNSRRCAHRHRRNSTTKT